MPTEIWIVQGKNKVRLTTKRGIDITDEVNNSLRTTLTKGEELVGKFVLSNSEGAELPLIQTLLAGLSIKGAVGHDTIEIGRGVKTVTTAGVDEALIAVPTPATWVIIQSQTDNTDKVAVGSEGVDATVATGDGVLLDPGDACTLLVPAGLRGLKDVFIDALVSGEGVRFTYGKR